jgi:hypothetical protein
VLFPLGVIVILFRNRNGLQSKGFLQRYGHLVRDYRSSFCFWEPVVMLKRVSTSAFVQFVSFKYDSYGTSFFAVSALFLFVLLDVFCFPYNRLECMTQSIMWSILLSISILSNSLVFNNVLGVPAATKELVEILLVIFIILSLIWVIYQVLTTILSSVQVSRKLHSLVPVYINNESLKVNTPIESRLGSMGIDQVIILPRTNPFTMCKQCHGSKHKLRVNYWRITFLKLVCLSFHLFNHPFDNFGSRTTMTSISTSLFLPELGLDYGGKV